MASNERRKGGFKAPVDRSLVARAIFNTAESMGIVNRERIEKLINQTIERLEKNLQPLPGMEELVINAPRHHQPPSEAEILALVKEVLGESEESMAKPKSTAKPSPVEPTRLLDNARTVLEKRYLAKNQKGEVIETPDDMFRRVACNIAQAELNYGTQAAAEHWEAQFYQLITSLDFLPNSPTLMNAGRELQQLSACFVLPVADSTEAIFDTVKHTALIHKSGGGTGFSFSRVRPEGDKVGSTGGVASGPVSFMRVFDTATDVIKQGGMRRGANMAILNVNHPDIEKFIVAKGNSSLFTNFNLSVAVTEDFMKAVEAGQEYDLIHPGTREVIKRLKAKDVFDKIVDMAWSTGDPGIIFIDRINSDNPTPNLGAIESTNPCGEQPLLPYESCNLGSINLSQMLAEQNGRFIIDYVKLAETTRLAVRFLDDVIDMNRFPLPQIAERTRGTRKIGLGVMGFADLLLKLGIPYNSDEATSLAAEVMKFISEEAKKASAEMGGERSAFPAFKGSLYDIPDGPPMRNATRTTIAPTGSLSIIAGCSSGIEPVFALSYYHHILDGPPLIEVHPYFEEVAKRHGFYSKELMEGLAQGRHLSEMEGIPDWVKRIFVTAHEITPEWHVKMQAAFQKYTDNAVSKTVNFPQTATREDIARVYMMAFHEGLKGITVYRDRSRDKQVLSLGDKESQAETKPEAKEEVKRTPRQRSKVTKGVTEKVTTGCGNIYITVNFDEQGNAFEVFTHLGKAGGCASAQLEAISRLISLALRSGLDVASIVKHLRGIRCPSIAWEEGHAVLSCADAIGNVLQRHTGGGQSKQSAHQIDFGLVSGNAGQCPDCGGVLVFQEGCHICPACGYSKCG